MTEALLNLSVFNHFYDFYHLTYTHTHTHTHTNKHFNSNVVVFMLNNLSWSVWLKLSSFGRCVLH